MIEHRSYRFPVVLLLLQILLTFLLVFHSEYQYYRVSNVANFEDLSRGLAKFYCSIFIDIHVMMFTGFGFLVKFLRRYLFDWDDTSGTFIIDVRNLSTADFVSASILISMGAVPGKVNAPQLILMTLTEVSMQMVY